ncbi:MAG: hypothetical protein ABIR51_02160 [Sphingomicrobium sp.]
MASIVHESSGLNRADVLSGTPRAGFVDRWIYVFTAAFFIAITLTGFIPDSVMKIAMVKAGQRPPFPAILHVHAVLMGSYLLLLLLQTWLMATGRPALHRRIGPVAMILVPLLVIVGFILIPTIYLSIWDGAHHAPPAARPALQQLSLKLDNIMLLQIRIGLLFPLFVFLGLRARVVDPGFHKRMMILGPAMALPAAFDRITWLPSTFPGSSLSATLYPLLAIAPMILWDVIRNRRVHNAYWLFLAINLPLAILVQAAWDTPWWHAAARRLMGV